MLGYWFEDAFFDRMRNEMDMFFRERNSPLDWNPPLLRAAEPPVNVWATDKDVRVTAEVPGIDPEKIDVSISGDTLTIAGEREEVNRGKKASVIREERFEGRFRKTLQLPFHVDTEKVEARYHNGILELTVPRTAEDQPKRIAVRAS